MIELLRGKKVFNRIILCVLFSAVIFLTVCPFGAYSVYGIPRSLLWNVMRPAFDPRFDADVIAPLPPLKIIFPNGSEVLKRGNTYTITWSTTNSHPVNINYLCEDGNEANIAQKVSNNGSFQWIVSVNNPSFKHCKISIQGDEYNFGDESDSYFTIE